MSLETIEWLNTNTRIGFTDKRGHAWHYRQGATNHFPGAVPMSEVLSLFGFDVLPVAVYVSSPGYVEPAIDVDGIMMENPNARADMRILTDRVAVVRADTGDIMGIFSDGYTIHPYSEWLVRNVETILDDTLQIGSAGLLRGGAQAWVSVEVPDNIDTPEGVSFRPNLLAVTSHDGSLATTYKRVVTITVC